MGRFITLPNVYIISSLALVLLKYFIPILKHVLSQFVYMCSPLDWINGGLEEELICISFVYLDPEIPQF